jgi:hypothetical protein
MAYSRYRNQPKLNIPLTDGVETTGIGNAQANPRYVTKPSPNIWMQAPRYGLAVAMRAIKTAAYGVAMVGLGIAVFYTPLFAVPASLFVFRTARRLFVDRDKLLAGRRRAEREGVWKGRFMRIIYPEPFFHKPLPTLAISEMTNAVVAPRSQPQPIAELAPPPNKEKQIDVPSISNTIVQPTAPVPKEATVKGRVRESPLLDSQGNQIPLLSFSRPKTGAWVWVFDVPKGEPMPGLDGLKQYLSNQKAIGHPISGTVLVTTDQVIQELSIRNGDQLQQVKTYPIEQLDALVEQRLSAQPGDAIVRESVSNTGIQENDLDIDPSRPRLEDLVFDEYEMPFDDTIPPPRDDMPPPSDETPPFDEGFSLQPEHWGLS